LTPLSLNLPACPLLCCPCLQEHGHIAREDILKDTRNHGPVDNPAGRLIVMQADYEEFASVR